ncbi:MAG TPA: STAS domain-containing protein [Planctomycetota bacterium]|nr:STAS domain-containing protein [Planctomycetota bacterium]
MNAEVKALAGGKVGLVCLEGEIDFSVLPDMRTALDQAVASKPLSLLVDLSGVTFIASDGLGVLIEAQRKADDDGRKFDLVHPQPHILGMLRKTQLTRLFKIFGSVDDALADLG